MDHLTPELLNQYREGNLSAEEMYAVEKYLLDNPFEAEALEGLEMVTSEELSGHLETLSSDIDKRLNEKQETKVIFWTNTRRMAAGLVILLAASFMYFWLPADQTLESDKITTKELSQNEKTEDNESIPEAAAARIADSVKNEESEPPGWMDSLTNPQASILPLQVASTIKDSSNTEGSLNEPVLLAAEFDIVDKAEEEVVSEALDLAEAAPAPAAMAKIKALTIPETKQDSNIVLDSFRAQNSIGVESQKRLAFTPRIIDGRANLVPDANLSLSASGSVITGIVKGIDDGLPLPQVTIFVPGTTIGVSTGADGKFSLPLDSVGDQLQVRYIGYKSQIVTIKGKGFLDISLEPDTQSLGEVVMVTRGAPKSSPARPEQPFDEYVAENLRYPAPAKARNIKGRVTVEFTVRATGKLADIKVIKGLGFGCDEEAIRLVQEGPAWTAKVERKTGKFVDSKVKVKVRFRP